MFVTKPGGPEATDLTAHAVTREAGKLVRKAWIARKELYYDTLRHTFQTDAN